MILLVRGFDVKQNFEWKINQKMKSNTGIDFWSIFGRFLDHFWNHNRLKIDSKASLIGLYMQSPRKEDTEWIFTNWKGWLSASPRLGRGAAALVFLQHFAWKSWFCRSKTSTFELTLGSGSVIVNVQRTCTVFVKTRCKCKNGSRHAVCAKRGGFQADASAADLSF